MQSERMATGILAIVFAAGAFCGCAKSSNTVQPATGTSPEEPSHLAPKTNDPSVVSASEKEQLRLLVEEPAHSMARLVTRRLSTVRTAYAEFDLAQTTSFDSVSRFLLSDVLLCRWQLPNIERSFLRTPIHEGTAPPFAMSDRDNQRLKSLARDFSTSLLMVLEDQRDAFASAYRESPRHGAISFADYFRSAYSLLCVRATEILVRDGVIPAAK